jgi:hypothetical protein
MLIIAVVIVSFYPMLGWWMRFGIAVWLFICLLILDLIDGHLARKLGHVTKFGTLFELTLDLLTHTVVWTLSGLFFAPFLIALEWTVGLHIAAFSLHPTENWKNILVQEGPWLVRVYFKPMQVNLLNDYSNVAHFVFPMTLFVSGTVNWISYLMLPGLIIFEVVSVYMLYTFMKILLVKES